MQEQIFEMASQTHILRLQTKYCNCWHMNHNSFPKIMFDMEAFSLLDCTCRSWDAKTFFFQNLSLRCSLSMSVAQTLVFIHSSTQAM